MKKNVVMKLFASISLALLLAGCGGGAADAPVITAKPMNSGGGGGSKTNATKTGVTPKNGGLPQKGGKGDLVGAIKYDGAAPALGKPKAFDPGNSNTDKFCVANAAKVIDESLVVDPASKGLKNAVVYLIDKPEGYNVPVPAAPIVFDQIACVFTPHVMAIRTGQQIKVVNSDDTTHNARTYPTRNDGYSKSLGAKQDSTVVLYKNPEKLPVKVDCSFHGWMSAYHVVLDHHFVDVTDKDGKFSIKGLPAGEHRFRVWHEKVGYLEKEISVVIKPGETTLNLSYKPATFASFKGPKPKNVLLTLSK